MKRFVTVAAALAIFAVPTFVFAQTSMPTRGSDTSPNAAPGSADSPMHGSHDKAPATRVDNNNGIHNGRSSSEQPHTGVDSATTGTH